MTDKTEMIMLLDFYGDVLTEKQREAMDMYYNDDYSLAEIADNTGISRQGVRDRLQKSEHILTELEEKLHLLRRFELMKSDVSKIIEKLGRIRHSALTDVEDIIEIAQNLLER